MTSKRVPLTLLLCAVLFVTGGFAATKKLHRNDRSRAWNDFSLQNDLPVQNDSSLQNGDLPSAGSSVSSGGGSDWLSGGGPSGVPVPRPANNPDNWNGGTGFWSNPGNWSNGEPGGTSTVTIYSGSNDTVTLDTSPTINSLTLGGMSKGTQSTLTDNGVAQTLTISSGLTIGVTGVLSLNGNGSSVSAGSIANSGVLFLGSGATLGLTNQPGGVTDVPGTAFWFVRGNFAVGGAANTGFANLASVEGDVFFENGQSQTIGGTLTISQSGSVQIAFANGTALTITGNVNNSGGISTASTGGSLSIGGTVTNGGSFGVGGQGAHGDLATIGNGLTNSGGVSVEAGGTLKITGDVTNSGNMYTGYGGAGSGGNTLNITGTLTNQATGGLSLDGFGSPDMATLGSLSNSGSVSVARGSTLKINGDVTNSGGMYKGIYTGLGGSGGNTVSITGTLTNSATFQLNGYGDMATIDAGVNNSGEFDVYNGSSATINNGLTNSGDFRISYSSATIDNGLTNSGAVNVENQSGLQINGDVTNSGVLGTSLFFFGGYDILNITGTLTNQATGQFALYGLGDQATLGGLLNSGVADVESGSTLQINGDVTNSGTLETNLLGNGGGNTITITGALTNNSGGSFLLYGPGDTATIGSVVNAGLIDLENNSNLTVNGDVNNSGNIYTSDLGGSGHNTITINGMLNEISGGQVVLFNPTDMLILNGGAAMNLQNGSALRTPILNNGGTIDVDILSTVLVGLGMLHGPITNYTQLANGTLGEIITPNSFGVINLHGGSALLAGTLDILLQGGFNPAVGKMYQFLIGVAPGQLNGTFDTIQNDIFNNGTEKWFVDYENGGGYVELIAEPNGSPVPEPATLLVLIPGLFGVGYGLRRKLCRP